MKIEIEVPDWAGDQCLRILSGIEIVAYKNVGELWRVKEVRCQRCGICCGECPDFEKRDIGYCKRGLYMPFLCVVSPADDEPYCKVRYKNLCE